MLFTSFFFFDQKKTKKKPKQIKKNNVQFEVLNLTYATITIPCRNAQISWRRSCGLRMKNTKPFIHNVCDFHNTDTMKTDQCVLSSKPIEHVNSAMSTYYFNLLRLEGFCSL